MHPAEDSAVRDSRWQAAAASLAVRARPLSRPNPAVGAIVVQAGRVVGRGWTGPGGRPHAEAVALAAAGEAAHGATLYVTLEPCAHQSARGPACADLVAASGLARVVAGCEDPDPRTAGQSLARIRAAGVAAELKPCAASQASLAGYLTRCRLGRPYITLKLALSHDGFLGHADATHRWMTGEAARAHCHAMRAKSEAILVGGGTLRADNPRLDVRLAGLEARSPQRWLLTRGQAPEGWHVLAAPEAVATMTDVQYLFVEGGGETARAFLAAGLVDCLLIYRAPIIVGGGAPSVPELSLASLEGSQSQWRRSDTRTLGIDTLEVYERSPCSPE